MDLKDFFGRGLSVEAPPSDAIIWSLWTSTEPIRQAVDETKFISKVRAGTLDALIFSGFNNSDFKYCWNAQEAFGTAQSRLKPSFLRDFFAYKHNRLIEFNKQLSDVLSLKCAEGTIPKAATSAYTAFQNQIMASYEPLYLLVVMTPCETLWPFVFDSMRPVPESHVYASWINANADIRYAHEICNCLELQRSSPDFCMERVRSIFVWAMYFEYANFNAATEERHMAPRQFSCFNDLCSDVNDIGYRILEEFGVLLN